MVSRSNGKIISTLIGLITLALGAFIGLSFYLSNSTIHSLLTENFELNRAITNLTAEEQIGYATVISQVTDSLGQTKTKLRFVQTAAGKPKEIVDEKIYLIEGDVIHFDALIVKFSDDYVKDVKARAL